MAVSRFIFSRIGNALRCYVGYALSRFGLVHISHAPMFVSVEPAAVCQLKCPACPVGNKTLAVSRTLLAEEKPIAPSQKLMSLEVFRRVLEEVREKAWVMQFYFQGEPLLNKDLPQMIQEAHEAGLYTIVSTNAQALTQETAEALVNAGLNRIIVSMDGLTQETYGAYRIGGDLEKAKAALRYLRAAKEKIQQLTANSQKPIIELQVLRLRTNEHEWREFKRVYKSLGADKLTFKTAQLYDYKNGHPLMPSDSRYSRYIKGSDGLYHRLPLPKGCFRVWSGVVVTTAGEVLPCCYDKEHAHAYGNLMNAPVSELFNNEKAVAFRRAAFQQQPGICKECWK